MNTQHAVHARQLGPVRKSAVFNHGLDAGEFTSDDALAAVLDGYPSDLIDINLYNFDAKGQVHLTAGTRGDLTGAQLLEAVRAGRLWVNLRKVEQYWPALWEAASDAFADISSAYSNLRAVKRSGQLIISSPKTRVPYHFDASGVVLFHMRGIKRMFVYPSDEAHQPEWAMEDIVARRTTEELPYDLSFEDDADVFELHPGEALIWPFYAPHRVENVDGPCVSLSVDFQTWHSRACTGSLYTHAFLRTRGMTPPSVAKLGGLNLALRWLASLPLRRLQVLGNGIASIPKQFVPDAKAEDGARFST